MIRLYNLPLSIFLFTMLLVVSFSSCSKEEESGFSAGFEYTIDESNPNQVTFINTSAGEYLYTEWDFGNGKTTPKETDKTKQHTIYFPSKGEYKVTLKVWGPTNSTKDIKIATNTIYIAEDDPDYSALEQLIWSDEFDGSSVNNSFWTFETGSSGWGNNELQNYTNGGNAEVRDGKLIITAKKINDDKAAGSYTSSRMVSKGKKDFTYGKMEIRAKLPSGRGIWPAIWMLGSNINSVSWPACGEIDIMEYVGYQPNTVYATVHTAAGSGANGDGSSKTLTTAEEEFHIYGLIWTEKELVFYIDSLDNVTHRYAPAVKKADNWPFDKPHFFILNVAVGGNWGGAQGIDNSIFPQSMEIDYVRVYQTND